MGESPHAIKRRAKRRLKNEFSSKKNSSHRNKSNLKKDYFENESIKVQLQHAFKSLGKWCSFPQEFEATREKITQDTNYYLQLTQRKEKHTKKRKTSPTSMLLVILFYKVPAVFNIFCCQI